MTPRVLLSSSFPQGDRGKGFEPFDTASIADAVTHTARTLLGHRCILVFGAHPTISPIVLMLARELGVPNSVEIHQSQRFRGRIPAETKLLASEGYGKIIWSRGTRRENRVRSLTRMRRSMIGEGTSWAGYSSVGWKASSESTRCLHEMQPQAKRFVFLRAGWCKSHAQSERRRDSERRAIPSIRRRDRCSARVESPRRVTTRFDPIDRTFRALAPSAFEDRVLEVRRCMEPARPRTWR